MPDNAYQRRREIERMLLSGKKLTIPYLMRIYGVSRNAIRKDLDTLSICLPVMSRQGYGGGYYLMEGFMPYQNVLSKEQIKCLEELAFTCSKEHKKVLYSMLYEFGPYQYTGPKDDQEK